MWERARGEEVARSARGCGIAGGGGATTHVFVARRGDGRPKTNVAPKNVHTLFFLVVGDVSANTMNLWWELCNLVESTSLSEEEDHIIWSFTSTGKYSVQSLYGVPLP